VVTGLLKSVPMKHSLVLLLFVLSLSIRAQEKYARIDADVKNLPEYGSTYDEIARTLTRGLSSEEEKYRALYVWIANNIQYDIRRYHADIDYSSQFNFVEDVMNTRSGVCQHYAELFHAMCKVLGLVSYVVGGYTYQDIGDEKSGHAWNLVRYDSLYAFIDPTWASGYVTDNRYVHEFRDKYFLVAPRDFIKSHIPIDPLWQCLLNPIDHAAFKAKDFSGLDQLGKFHFIDSIARYNQQDQLNRLSSANRRIAPHVKVNLIVLQQYQQNLKNISYLKFNKGIDTLNYAISFYNDYINAKNNMFLEPPMSDEVIKYTINEAHKSLRFAEGLLNSIQSRDKQMLQNLRDTQRSIHEMSRSIEGELEFVNQYVHKTEALRKMMFFK
jgi:hypothetical protein